MTEVIPHEAIPRQHSHSAEPLVSVILAVYNGEAFIGQTLESASRQTYRHIEIIVVDDGSTDGTSAVVERCRTADQRIRLIRQSNSGVARARNRGLAAARGEFIAPLDADDLWEPTKIQRQVERMHQCGQETGLVYTWWVWIDHEGSILDRSPAWRIEGNALLPLLQVNFTASASVPLYRRRCLDDVGGYDETLQQRQAGGCEDWDLALRVAARYRVAVVPSLLVGYRRLPGSMSTHLESMWRSQASVTESVRERERGIPREALQRSKDQFSLYLAGVMFWSGRYWRAARYAFRAWRSVLFWRVLPYAARVLIKRLFRRLLSRRSVMIPGQRLETEKIPGPLIPYHRIYNRLLVRDNPSLPVVHDPAPTIQRSGGVDER